MNSCWEFRIALGHVDLHARKLPNLKTRFPFHCQDRFFSMSFGLHRHAPNHFLSKIVSRAIAILGCLFDLFWSLFGSLWDPLGPPWAPFAFPLARLGAPWPFWELRRRTWVLNFMVLITLTCAGVLF